MAHDVFISHSSKDAETAMKICDIFENNKLKCWIAPRDVTVGQDYDMEILDGIENAKVFILILSDNSNISKHVKRELEIAASNELSIFPIRISNVEPSRLLKYFLAGKHWSDIWNPDFARKVQKVGIVIQDLLGYNNKKKETKEKVIFQEEPVQFKNKPILDKSQTVLVKESNARRFIERKLGNETVIFDNNTNLLWQVNKLPEFIHNYNDALNWITTSNTIRFAGFNDWRLPTLDEARSLITETKQKRLDNKHGYTKYNGDIYLDPIFPHFICIWTDHKVLQNGKENRYVVNFAQGIPSLPQSSSMIAMGVMAFDLSKFDTTTSNEKKDGNLYQKPLNPSSDIEKSVHELLNEMDLHVGRQSHFMQIGSTPIQAYGNSEAIFRKFRKIGDKDDVASTLATIVSSNNEKEINKWKSVVILKYFKDYSNVDCIDSIIGSVNEDNKDISSFLHVECVRYLDAINTPKIREIITPKYLKIIYDCPTNTARNDAINSYSVGGKSNDDSYIKTLIDLVEAETDKGIRKTAIYGLKNYNLSSYTQTLVDWFEDTDQDIRNMAVFLCLDLEIDIRPSEIIELLEFEKYNSCRFNLVKLLYKVDSLECDNYFCEQINSEEEKIMLQAIKDSFHLPKLESFLLKIKALDNDNINSPELSKNIKSYIVKYDK